MKWKINNITIKNQVVLAPMAGISNPAYMKICEELSLGYAITELISAEAISRNNQKTLAMLNGIEDLNIPVAIQLFGSNPEIMAQAAKIINQKYPQAIIDINMGCPVPKVAIKNEAGSALLKNPNKIYEIVKSVVSCVDVPVTVKIRSGWDEKSINAILVAKTVEEAGASAISIHARTRSQGYGGTADWSIIKKVKENVKIPVIGNGDVLSCYDAKRMLQETKCDAVMIGRAVLGNPWLIKECVDYLEDGTIPIDITASDKIKMLKKHYKLLQQYTTEKQAILEIRTHALWYIKGLPGSALIKNKICKCQNSTELFNTIDDYLKTISK